jgi:hypothetical protein
VRGTASPAHTTPAATGQAIPDDRVALRERRGHDLNGLTRRQRVWSAVAFAVHGNPCSNARFTDASKAFSRYGATALERERIFPAAIG